MTQQTSTTEGTTGSSIVTDVYYTGCYLRSGTGADTYCEVPLPAAFTAPDGITDDNELFLYEQLMAHLHQQGHINPQLVGPLYLYLGDCGIGVL